MRNPFDKSKCLHYYFYFIDKELGLCYLRVPTWAPFRLQFYMNGTIFLPISCKKRTSVTVCMTRPSWKFLMWKPHRNSLTASNPEDLHKILDVFTKHYCPIADSPELGYTWTVQQIECATDVMFKRQADLEPLYDDIICTAIHTVKPDNIATFLGQCITYNCKKEVGTNYNQRILGTRIKHHMGDVSIKMYDKFGIVLQIESTCNNIGTFQVKRKVGHRDGSSTEQKAPLKKSIYSLYHLFTIIKAANYRYHEFVSSFDDHSNGNKNLVKATNPVVENKRSYRGFNFFAARDLEVLEAISKGEYMTFGMQGKDIRQHLGNISASAMSRIFKRLRLHGIIERKAGIYKYFPTTYGKQIIAAELTVKNLVLIPALA